MHPILFTFSIGTEIWALKAYPLFLFLAGLVAVGGGAYAAQKNNINLKRALVFLLILLAAAFIGARLLHGITNIGYYHEHPERWLALDTQGFAIFGGIIFAIVISILSAKILKINLWRMGDGLAPFLGISIALVRVGCFLNGCCFGKETNIFWGVTFPFFSPAHKYQLSHNIANIFSVVPVHPTQIYELIAALIGSGIALYCIKKKLPDGIAISAFVIWFALFRLGNYFLRAQMDTFTAPAYFYPALYVVLILLGIFLLIQRLRDSNH